MAGVANAWPSDPSADPIDGGPETAAALAGIRVIDIASRYGNYAGKLFADLGADVILVEHPDGRDGVRSRAPFVADRPGAESSLWHLYQNSNKRSLLLDLDTPGGADTLRRLACSADLLIEATHPGTMDRRGLGQAALRAVAPRLVYTSITPFGQTGPFAGFEADDLTLMAMGGLLYLAGYPDAAPTVAYGDQSLSAGGLFAAVASLAAVLRAEAGGGGEHIDLSIQQSVVLALENAAQTYDLAGIVRKRSAGMMREAGSGLFPCKDGYILLLASGVGDTKLWAGFADWLGSQGIDEAAIFKQPEWNDPAFNGTPEAIARFNAMFLPFAARRTRLEIFESARARRIALAPVSTPAEVVASEHFRCRGFFVGYDEPLFGRRITMPGAPYRLDRTPWRLRRRAPRLGEHSAAILSLLDARAAGRPAAATIAP